MGYIADLMELELDGAVAAMALDSTVDSKYKTKIGLEATDPYFNSGVMLIDVEKWQHQNILDKIQNLANSGRRFNTVDQDYVNIALLGKCKTISNKFNFQPFHKRYTPKQYLSVYQKKSLYYDMQELIDAEDDIRIIHFFRYLGMHPWDMKSMHPFEKEFIYYRDKVPKASFQMMTPNNLTLTIRIERGLYKILPKVSFLRAFRMAHNRMLEK